MKTFSQILFAAVLSLLCAAESARAQAVGVDGVIGAEWASVTPTTVPYTGGSPPDAHLVGFNVYLRCDANYVYVGLQALPATNPSGWCDAYNLGLGASVNLYLDTDPGTNPGADLGFFPLGGFIYTHAYGDPDLTNERDMDARPTEIITAFNEGNPGDCSDASTQVGGVREFAIAWSLLENDPDGLGFPKLTASNKVVNVRTVQAFGYNFSGEQFTNRFGSCTDPHFPNISCGNNKVFICHKGKNTLCISVNAVQAHLNHGDVLGPCPLSAAGLIEGAVPEIPVAGEAKAQTPVEFMLHENYPNPFNPSTTLQFDLPEPAVVSLKVYNTLGQEVATLLDNMSYNPGRHNVTFDASRLSSGVYIYRMLAGRYVSTKTMLLLK
ncbi:MAG: T9SS type A sorting domain-containing protein [Bacteroidota bacterium]